MKHDKRTEKNDSTCPEVTDLIYKMLLYDDTSGQLYYIRQHVMQCK